MLRFGQHAARGIHKRWFVAVAGGSAVTAFFLDSPQYADTAAAKLSSRVYSWGASHFGQLGLGDEVGFSALPTISLGRVFYFMMMV